MNSKMIIPSIAFATVLAGCWKKVPDIDITLVETSQTCNHILFRLAENCTTKAEIKWIKLNWTSNYSIAWMAWRENDTGNIQKSDIDVNTKDSIRKIKETVEDKVNDENLFSTDITTKITWITLNWKANWYSSVIWNMDWNKYSPGYWLLDSNNSEESIKLNKINAISRCNETINTIWKNVTPNVINNVKCEWETIPFSYGETSKLLTLWGWLLETNPEYRSKDISPGIVAFSHIKWIESWKIKNSWVDALLEKELDEATSIIKSKHFVKIDWVNANIWLEINENKISDIAKLLLSFWGIMWIIFWVLARRKSKNENSIKEI